MKQYFVKIWIQNRYDFEEVVKAKDLTELIILITTWQRSLQNPILPILELSIKELPETNQIQKANELLKWIV